MIKEPSTDSRAIYVIKIATGVVVTISATALIIACARPLMPAQFIARLSVANFGSSLPTILQHLNNARSAVIYFGLLLQPCIAAFRTFRDWYKSGSLPGFDVADRFTRHLSDTADQQRPNTKVKELQAQIQVLLEAGEQQQQKIDEQEQKIGDQQKRMNQQQQQLDEQKERMDQQQQHIAHQDRHSGQQQEQLNQLNQTVEQLKALLLPPASQQ